MRRVQLVELEDLPWVPQAIRDGGTDLLDLAFGRMGFYDGVAPQLASILAATGETRIVDLGSGGGGGALHLRQHLRRGGNSADIVLTDRYPSEGGMARVSALGDPATRYEREPVDAKDGGGDRPGVRTMSGALHHFPPDAVRALIAGVVARRAPLAFFDVAASPGIRRMPVVLAPIAMALNGAALFVASLLLMPLVRPVRPSRWALTYLLPLIPLLVAWDGTVSALRAYTPDELLTFARSVPGGDTYAWQAGASGRALFITGRPL
jgi:hypothetical protein